MSLFQRFINGKNHSEKLIGGVATVDFCKVQNIINTKRKIVSKVCEISEMFMLRK